MAAIYALRTFPQIAFDRHGTHCLEQYFGNVRSMCNDFDSYKNIIKNCVKTLINNSINVKYNLKNIIYGRINMAGAKMLANEDKCTIQLSGIEDLNPQMITASFFGLVGEVGLGCNEIGGPFGPPQPNDLQNQELENIFRAKH